MQAWIRLREDLIYHVFPLEYGLVTTSVIGMLFCAFAMYAGACVELFVSGTANMLYVLCVRARVQQTRHVSTR